MSDNQPMFLRLNIASCSRSYVSPVLPGLILRLGEGDYQCGDHTTALRKLWPVAEQGNHSARFFLGICYANGYGVTRNLEMTLHWYRLSSAQGNWRAQNDLGMMYHNGDGVLQDYEEATRLYRWVLKGLHGCPEQSCAMYYPCITRVEAYVTIYGRPLD